MVLNITRENPTLSHQRHHFTRTSPLSAISGFSCLDPSIVSLGCCMLAWKMGCRPNGRDYMEISQGSSIDHATWGGEVFRFSHDFDRLMLFDWMLKQSSRLSSRQCSRFSSRLGSRSSFLSRTEFTWPLVYVIIWQATTLSRWHASRLLDAPISWSHLGTHDRQFTNAQDAQNVDDWSELIFG